MTVKTVSPETSDGRRARSERSREAIARAMLDLVRETGRTPTMEAVAERADVSRRSVFRHFADVDELILAACEMQRADVAQRFRSRDLSRLGLEERVHAVAERFGRLYEYVAPFRRVASAVRHENPVVDQTLKEDDRALEGYLMAVFRDVFAPLSDEEARLTLQCMTTALGWPAWVALRRDQGLTVLQARKVVERLLRATATTARAA